MTTPEIYYCAEYECLRKIFEPHLYCNAHEDSNSTPPTASSMTTPEDIDHADILFAIAMTLASQHTTGLINKEKAIESIKEHAQSLITLHTQKARLDEVKQYRKSYPKKNGRDNDLSKMTRADVDRRITQLTNPTERSE